MIIHHLLCKRWQITLWTCVVHAVLWKKKNQNSISILSAITLWTFLLYLEFILPYYKHISHFFSLSHIPVFPLVPSRCHWYEKWKNLIGLLYHFVAQNFIFVCILCAPLLALSPFSKIFFMLQGLSNRKLGATAVNSKSSRSHIIFTCIIESWYKVIFLIIGVELIFFYA